jgi:AraC family transcriptional regulator, regulatory protein of adaptative response / methylated-DNA-[protein]-cysteine methyltransferase
VKEQDPEFAGRDGLSWWLKKTSANLDEEQRMGIAMTKPTRGTKAAAPRFLTEGDRWDAVRSRDKTADGQFVYAVRTTGVFCHPSCPSRPAKRENVTFYGSPGDAASAGYRACKRCRPGETSRDDRHACAIATAISSADARLASGEPAPSLDELARAAGMSPFHFHRIFKATMGITPKAYLGAQRARHLRDRLDGAADVTTAIHGAGYGSSSRFYVGAQDRLGMTPTTYRRGGAGVTIRFAVGQCSLGAIIVAATDRGICAIEFGDDPDLLVRGLQDRFPKAELVGADQTFESLVAQVVGAVETPANAARLPLDVLGTAFQERVWQALRAIPAGKTLTYAELAKTMGLPKATRAVANACAANPAAVAIPCHRVVRTDGGLGGYRWGIARKEALLARERTSLE